MKKLLLVLSFFILSSSGFALNRNIQDPFNDDGDLEVLRCIEKGGFELKLFWDSMVYSDSLSDGLVEPIADIVSRNQCHVNDIMMLAKQQDKIRKQIREATFRCETEKLPRLKKAYNKVRAEIFYVRNVVDTTVSIGLPYDLLGTDSIGNFALVDRDEIYTEMVQKYVNDDFFTLEELNNFFFELENKYSRRVASYIKCERGSWQTVGEKWQEFRAHFEEDFGGLKEAGSNIAASADAFGNTVLNTNTVKLLRGEDSVGGFVSSFYNININGLPAKKGANEILSDLKANFSDTDVGSFASVSQSDFIGAYQNSNDLFDKEAEIARISAEFRQVYRGSGDTVEVFLNSLDGRDSAEDFGLIEMLEESIPEIEEINDFTKVMNRRQCSL